MNMSASPSSSMARPASSNGVKKPLKTKMEKCELAPQLNPV